MQKQISKIIVIMGPTSSGKSGVAIELAKKFNGEIISADSRQVYTGMNLGTGKIPRDKFSQISNFQPASRRQADVSASRDGFPISKQNEKFISEGIAHHLIDVAEPMEDFNISHFKTLANIAIEEILSKGKIPIICGGTAFWIDAIVKNTFIPEVAPNIKLREKLEKESVEELFLQLQKLDPRRAKDIDSRNKVRLIRAIEICEKLGTVPELQINHCHSGTSCLPAGRDPESSKSHLLANNLDSRFHGNDSNEYDFLQIGISTDRADLNEKIKKRLEERFNDGIIQEVQILHNKGVTLEWMERIGLEYRWISRFLQNKVSEDEMRKKLYFDIIHYAKRQMTWLKRNKDIIWFENYQDIENEVTKFLTKK